MPNLTFFIAADQMPPDARLSQLTDRSAELCIGVLQAAPENVHIIYAPVRHGRGHPVFASISYRLTASRTPEVMDHFMAELDAAIHEATGLTARIRCFGYAASQIHARN